MLNLLITCVNYSDYLSYTLPYNVTIFDNIYIVTTEQDKNTHRVINKLNSIKQNITTLYTNIFFEDGPWGKTHFNKGGALNFGLSNIEHKDWIIIGDADIIYPLNIINQLPNLEIECLHGMYRYKINKSEDILAAIKSYEREEVYNTYGKDAIIQYGLRKHGIIGYCQLFNFSSTCIKNGFSYPQGPTAFAVDTQFSRGYFPRKYRRLNKNYCLHLGEVCINWKGRVTKKWD